MVLIVSGFSFIVEPSVVVVQLAAIFRIKFRSTDINNSNVLGRVITNIVFPAICQTAIEIPNNNSFLR